MQRHNLFIITGAGRGFGRVIAEAVKENEISKQPTTVVLVGRDSATLDQVAATLTGPTVKSNTIANADFGNLSTIQQIILPGIKKIVDDVQATGTPITNVYLINNAGSTGDLSKKIADYNADEVQSYYNVNVVSFISLVSAIINLFRKPQSSDETPFPPDLSIVNISSLLAVKAFPNWGLYASGKAARDMFLQVLAAEHQDGSVKTLSYAPGPLDNDMQLQCRETLGDAEQKQLYTSMAEQVRISRAFEFYINCYADKILQGKLVKMEESAKKLLNLLFDNSYESGAHIDFYD